MPEKMPTIAEFARTLGVSKSNVVNKIKELDLETVTKPGDRRRCQYLPEGTCSVLADKLAKTKPAVQADETRLLDLYQAQVEPLKSANASLQRQVQLLMDQLAAAEGAGLAPFVRIGEMSRRSVLHPLDAGAAGTVIDGSAPDDQIKHEIPFFCAIISSRPQAGSR